MSVNERKYIQRSINKPKAACMGVNDLKLAKMSL